LRMYIERERERTLLFVCCSGLSDRRYVCMNICMHRERERERAQVFYVYIWGERTQFFERTRFFEYIYEEREREHYVLSLRENTIF
jgi:hypothetical protein